jgi:hypothetical protein
VGFLAAVYPAFSERARMFHAAHQRQSDTAKLVSEDSNLLRLLQALSELPHGRTYIGSNNSWQRDLLVAGYMPLDLMTAARGIQTVGGILFHGFSIAGETLFDFNPSNAEHFRLFGIRSIVSPSNWYGTPGFSRIGQYGRFALWSRDANTMFVGDERFDSEARLSTDFVRLFVHQIVGREDLPGEFKNQRMDHPWQAEGTVNMSQPGSVVAAIGFHPGWQALLNGTPVITRRVPPGFVAFDVPSGTHAVELRYRGSSLKGFFLLFALFVIAVCLYKSGRRFT